MSGATTIGAADFEVCNRSLARICGAYRLECERWWEFRGGITTRGAGSLEVADIRFSTGRVIRDRTDDEHYMGDYYFLVLQASGTAVMRQRGRAAYLRPGDCTVIDSRYPSIFEVGSHFHQYSFHICAQRMTDRFRANQLPVAHTIGGQRGAGGVLSDTLLSILRHGNALEGIDLTNLTVQLLANAIGATAGPTNSVERTTLSLQEITDYLDTRLHEPDLAPRRIAEYFNISLRQLYRIVTTAGCTPAALIWKRRLDQARTLLTNTTARMPITEIALSCGFKDGAHFSRSYRKAFGMPPRAARDCQASAGVDDFCALQEIARVGAGRLQTL
jgi:AraC family transcriptional activator of tynA and feaB